MASRTLIQDDLIIPCARRRFLRMTGVTIAGSLASVLLNSRQRAEAAESASSDCPKSELPMKEVEGKVAFITGGSSGIGLGIARAFLEAGMRIAIGYRSKAHLENAMTYLKTPDNRTHAINVDVTDRAGMERAADEVSRIFGKIHVLVNNAGVLHSSAFVSTTYDDWDWQIGVNLTGVFNGVHAFLPRIQAHKEGGQVVTTSSILGLFTGAHLAGYSASKYAVVGMMESLRAKLAGTNIGVSAFCPGLVMSNILDSARNRPPTFSATKTKGPTGAQPEELALDPLEAGRLVLRGIKNNDLYIFTHPEVMGPIRDRNDALINSIPKDILLTGARLTAARSKPQPSIYSIERDRKRCSAGASRRR